MVIKRLHRHLAHDAACAAMFAHEARALAALAPGVAGLAEVPGLDPAREFAQASRRASGSTSRMASLWAGCLCGGLRGGGAAPSTLAHVHASRARTVRRCGSSTATSAPPT